MFCPQFEHEKLSFKTWIGDLWNQNVKVLFVTCNREILFHLLEWLLRPFQIEELVLWAISHAMSDKTCSGSVFFGCQLLLTRESSKGYQYYKTKVWKTKFLFIFSAIFITSLVWSHDRGQTQYICYLQRRFLRLVNFVCYCILYRSSRL